MLHLGLGVSGISAADSSPGNAGASGHDPNPPPPEDPTITLTTDDPQVGSGNAATCHATLSYARDVDTVIDASTDIGAAEIVSPITILAGNLSVQFFVANTGGYEGDVIYTATSDIVVNNTLTFQFAA